MKQIKRYFAKIMMAAIFSQKFRLQKKLLGQFIVTHYIWRQKKVVILKLLTFLSFNVLNIVFKEVYGFCNI